MLSIQNLSTCLFILVLSLTSGSLLAVQSATGKTTTSAEFIDKQLSKKELRKQRRAFIKSMKPAKSGLLANIKFRFGFYAFTFGLAFSILDWLLAGAAIFGYLGILGIIVGVVLMVWGLLEHFE